jgi:hypothetical protein
MRSQTRTGPRSERPVSEFRVSDRNSETRKCFCANKVPSFRVSEKDGNGGRRGVQRDVVAESRAHAIQNNSETRKPTPRQDLTLFSLSL